MIFVGFHSYAQEYTLKSHLYVGAKLGINAPFGDFNFFSSEENKINPNISIFLEKDWNYWMTSRIELGYGWLGGTKEYPRIGQDPIYAWFDASLFQLNLQAKIEILRIISGNRQRNLSWYGLLGIGMDMYSSQKIRPYVSGDQQINLPNTQLGDVSVLKFILGTGFGYRLNDHWTLIAEGGYHIPDSDEPDLTIGGSKYDIYAFASAGFAYHLNPTALSGQLLPYQETKALLEYGVPLRALDKDQDSAKNDLSSDSGDPSNQPAPFRMDLPSIIDGKDKFNIRFDLELIDQVVSGIIRVHHPAGIVLANPRLPYANFTPGTYESIIKINALYIPETVEINVSATADTRLFSSPEDSFIIFADLKTDEDETFITKYYNYFFKNSKGFYQLGQEQKKISSAIKDEAVSGKENYKPVDYTKTDASDIEFYSVQVMAQRKIRITLQEAEEAFGLQNLIEEKFADGWIRFRSGHFKTLEEALAYRDKLRSNNGIKGAFVVGFTNGKRHAESSLNKEGRYHFKIQIHSSPQQIDIEDLVDAYALDVAITEELNQNMYRYMAGDYSSYRDAVKAKDDMIALHDIEGAFVIAYLGDQKLNKIPEHLLKSAKSTSKTSGRKPKPSQTTSLKPSKDTSGMQLPKTAKTDQDDYRILFKKSSLPIPDADLKSYFKTPEKISSELYGGNYYYFVGNFKSIDVAIGYLEYLNENLNLKDGKLVRFANGERVSPLE